ncbi:hypothetical protein [Tenacibaculum sp. IB213877]|uniref:hypothetical protein n=1 Tax=Tenacibaculum sp. IB213877 TaxID=3097351 RepID=UPI002A5A1A75|nr:hypothetical protein [Tenacibaculum sp. IB213877]MDY0780573.1 hypothetical protein [Tenacibaculum sp. IB213877]
MKNIILFILLLFITIEPFFGQETQKEKIDSILSHVQELAKVDKLTNIGAFSMINKEIPILPIKVHTFLGLNLGINDLSDSEAIKSKKGDINQSIKDNIKDKIRFKKLDIANEKIIKKIKADSIKVLDKKIKNLALSLNKSSSDSISIISREIKKTIDERERLENKTNIQLIEDLTGVTQSSLEDVLDIQERWKVDKIDMYIEDGFITDISVSLFNEVTNSPERRHFSNRSPISILRFHHYNDWILWEENNKSKGIYLKNVLRYQHVRGNNFSPENKRVVLTRKEPNEILELNNNLNSFINLKVYSDFLGLINETPNGIISFEASSDIHLVPGNIGLIHIGKKISPFVRYSRFDNDDRAIIINNNKIDNKLELSQKAFIVSGLDLNLLEVKLGKEYPFSFSIPVRFQLNIGETNNSTSNSSDNINTVVWGSGISANFRKIRNFGLAISVDLNLYDHKNNSDIIEKVKDFSTIGVNAEMYYYDSTNKNSAFFLRLKTERILNNEENYASIQFGYKTALNFNQKK